MRHPGKDQNHPADLADIVEATRPLPHTTIQRLLDKQELIREWQTHILVTDAHLETSARFGRALMGLVDLGICRDKMFAGALLAAGLRGRPAETWHALCVAVSGVLRREYAGDLAAVLSMLTHVGIWWSELDPPPEETLYELKTTPTPEWLARSDKLRASGVKGASFAALCAEGLGILVATGHMRPEHAEETWSRNWWRSSSDLNQLVNAI
jgi:hypothetical protein